MDSLYPLYNVSAVLSSPAGQAIACISKTKLDASKSIELRKESQVTCERKNDFPSCKDGCLFDVSSNADECETRDISSSHPKVCRDIIVLYIFFVVYTYKKLKHKNHFLRWSRNFKILSKNNTNYWSIKFPP